MNDVLTMMLIVGLFISFAILGIFIWGAKGGQFDDTKKMMDGLLFDSQEDLNDAINREKKLKESMKPKEEKSKKE
ncbi:MAG: cbb3-type cytochrome oxidase assembly protein CcoS [Sulfurimonadaceae bacterium]|jgi:cbb3-type cytochrome oxidase maturation protein|nr:cbb3-type cytochrome oxidase assembly protein CcoS [Arcobacteraceae bacterium]MDX9795724.1 cbb3-type cytochrome oxidase assembly protein CcoS [Arcobacteraceae bacterium]